MNASKHPIIALLLACIPGLGQWYAGRFVRGVLFGGAFFGTLLALGLAIAIRIDRYFGRSEFLYILLLLALAGIWIVNMIDMLRLITALPRPVYASYDGVRAPSSAPEEKQGRPFADQPALSELYRQNERFKTILLSVIPGMGHFQLGLMQRGLAFLITFFGSIMMVLFVAEVTRQTGFYAFLGIAPVIWLYGLFDCLQQLSKREQGEALIDRSFFEDFQEQRETGKKNKTLAMILSLFPGAGHMYAGAQRRGLQLMAAFLFGIYVMDALRLSLFLFLIPLVWFFSFFDALQHISRLNGPQELRDVPVFDWIVLRQRWVGGLMLALGAYYLFDHILINGLDLWLDQELVRRINGWYYNYFQTFVVSLLLIGGGIWFLSGKGEGRRR